MRRQLLPAVLMMVVFTVIFGLAYPLVVTGIAQGAFGDKADGSLLEHNGQPVGSRLIGQAFVDETGAPLPEYFQSRPSAATGADDATEAGYDPTASSGSNLGPTNPCLVPVDDGVCMADTGEEVPPAVLERIREYRELNGLDPDAPVPVDAVTASGSGLDPHISVANARLQAPRVARERDLALVDVLELVDEHTAGRDLGFLGEKRVSVLELNVALDERARP
jgi:K+-transporting ATPase ATPase C chain